MFGEDGGDVGFNRFGVGDVSVVGGDFGDVIGMMLEINLYCLGLFWEFIV